MTRHPLSRAVYRFKMAQAHPDLRVQPLMVGSALSFLATHVAVIRDIG
jgi:hypothetical protein